MNKDKVIKDLRERNDKLKNQYEIMQIRNCSLEQHIKTLEKRNKELEDGFKATTQELCEYAEENETLKNLNVCVGCDNNPSYKARIDKAIEYIKNENTERFNNPTYEFALNIRKEKLLEILGDDNSEKTNN